MLKEQMFGVRTKRSSTRKKLQMARIAKNSRRKNTPIFAPKNSWSFSWVSAGDSVFVQWYFFKLTDVFWHLTTKNSCDTTNSNLWFGARFFVTFTRLLLTPLIPKQTGRFFLERVKVFLSVCKPTDGNCLFRLAMGSLLRELWLRKLFGFSSRFKTQLCGGFFGWPEIGLYLWGGSEIRKMLIKCLSYFAGLSHVYVCWFFRRKPDYSHQKPAPKVSFAPFNIRVFRGFFAVDQLVFAGVTWFLCYSKKSTFLLQISSLFVCNVKKQKLCKTRLISSIFVRFASIFGFLLQLAAWTAAKTNRMRNNFTQKTVGSSPLVSSQTHPVFSQLSAVFCSTCKHSPWTD